MVFLVGGANSASGGYEISNSLRFGTNDERLEFTTSSAGNDRTFTLSFWLKKWANAGANQTFFYTQDDAQNYLRFYFDASESIELRVYISNSLNTRLHTNRLFRDPSAWYHIVVAVDTTQGVEANRVKLYINGVQETSLSTATYPSVNTDYPINNSSTLYEVANEHYAHAEELKGYLADYNFIDGTAEAPTSFGETNDNGVWVPKKYSGSYGQNGFFLEFKQTGTSADASGKGADTSGQGNHFDDFVLAATDVTTDTPTNNFATINPLANNIYAPGTISEGNLKFSSAATGYSYRLATIGVTSGKWYWEVKAVSFAGGTDPFQIGVTSTQSSGISNELGASANDWAYTEDGNKYTSGSGTSYGSTYTSGDIVGIAMDLDNLKLYFSKNGTWQNSGDPESGSTGTGALALTAVASTGLGFYFPAIADWDNAGGSVMEINFGNPSFSGTDKSDANGYGSFEYQPPSGYYALCTKNLAEYG